MPFLGLYDRDGNEIRGDGYHRLDMSEIGFKINPPKNPEVHFTFINTSWIKWPVANGKWPDVYGLCVFSEIDDKQPAIVSSFPGPPRDMHEGSMLTTSPGQLTMDMTVTPAGSNTPKEKSEIELLKKINAELVAVLEKIASLRHGPAAALARSALDTMRHS